MITGASQADIVCSVDFELGPGGHVLYGCLAMGQTQWDPILG